MSSPRAEPPRSKKEATHDLILEVAARALRREGFAGVRVADVMAEAGLTHGGFYAHFPSRDALLAEALARAARDSSAVITEAASHRPPGTSAFRALVDAYLSDKHLGSCETGCPVAALGAEMPRQSLAVRETSVLRVERLIAAVAETLPGRPRGDAASVTSTLVGALQLARVLGDNDEGRAHLAAVRASLLADHDKPRR